MVLISNNLLNAQALNIKQASSIDSLLKVGQVLTANIQSVKGNQVQLSIGNQTLLATAKQPIQESGTIQVRVNQVKPDVQLAIVNSQSKAPTQTATQQTLQAAYRQFIPNQAPLSQVFQQINLLQSLPPSLQAPIQQLLDQVNKGNQNPNGQTIKQKLADSGLFLESKLSKANSTTPQSQIKNDIKAQILQLQQQVSSLQQQSSSTSVNKLSTLLSQALSRLTVQQVQLFENPNITPLELPFTRDNSINRDYIEIRQNSQSSKASWEAYVDLTLPQGLLSVKLRFTEDDELDCYIWCETDELTKSVEQSLHLLKEALDSKENRFINIQLTPKKPEKTDNTTKIALIDIKI